MRTITFTSGSKTKIELLSRVAKEMGIEQFKETELSDEEMALPGKKPSKQKLEKWLAKNDGEEYAADAAFNYVKKQLALLRKRQ